MTSVASVKETDFDMLTETLKVLQWLESRYDKLKEAAHPQRKKNRNLAVRTITLGIGDICWKHKKFGEKVNSCVLPCYFQ